MVATLYVARHGLRANLDPSPTGIDGDPRLTEEGDVQANELGKYVAKLPINAIFSSPFYRCLQTAEPSAELLGIPVFVERGLSEHYIPTRPTKPVPWTAERSLQTFPYFKQIDPSFKSQVGVSTKGETRDELKDRMKRAMDAIFKHSDEHNYKNILVFTHAAVKITIGEVLANVEGRAGTCSLDTYVCEGDNWTPVKLGDTSFLSGGEQMHWSFDMAFEAGSAADVASRASTKEDAPHVPTTKHLVSLDTSALAPPDVPSTLDQSEMAFHQLESDRPLIQIGSKLYEGEWLDTVGTEVYTTQQGKPIGKASQTIKLYPARVEAEQKDRRRLAERVKSADEQKNNK